MLKGCFGNYHPLMLQIKPLPPRPVDEAGIGTNNSSLVAHGGSHITTAPLASTTATTTTTSVSKVQPSLQTVTPPAGYPPLPPGYTLTQPMAPPSSSVVPTSVASHSTTANYANSSASQGPTLVGSIDNLCV